jgi:hypothetical protein
VKTAEVSRVPRRQCVERYVLRHPQRTSALVILIAAVLAAVAFALTDADATADIRELVRLLLAS